MRYKTLLRVLDRIRAEAPTEQASRYRPDEAELEKINQARARAFIHLYMKVMFGLANFSERERTITDGGYDGGIDGYYIDTESKLVYLVQSKFRTTAKNFESKEIALEELLAMDVSRILDGETTDETGNDYNGKIKQLQREIASLTDVARYSYRVVILANLGGVTQSKLRLLTGGYSTEVFDFEKTYQRLVFPVITGTYFAATDIVIPIDLSNKNAGSKISYNVRTKYGSCEITLLFVPTPEVAKLMSKYRNAVLKYNPRSYLDLEGQSVNAAIRSTIVDSATNEFALYNNGITMLSEETNINEKIGQKNKAQLRIKNPQIINGGQTSFTLSRIFEDNTSSNDDVFDDKEVLLKIITLGDNASPESKLELIDQVSNATNKQTPVINADRFANEAFHVAVQSKTFERHGLLYERKRGEFSAGVKDGYIEAKSIIERNFFWRIYYASNGQTDKGIQRRLFQKNSFPNVSVDQNDPFDRAFLGLMVFEKLRGGARANLPLDRETYFKVFMFTELYFLSGMVDWTSEVAAKWPGFLNLWEEFTTRQRRKHGPKQRAYIDKNTGEARIKLTEPKHVVGPSFASDLEKFIAEVKQRAP
ncbi:MAG: AIPR family protein [Betaproteobacteria bacterium]|nr:AIPR family protein [Betaproteobacteria bacterium]